MRGLASLKNEVRDNTHMLNSVRTAELTKITQAQRLLSSFYGKGGRKTPAKKRKPAKKVGKKK